MKNLVYLYLVIFLFTSCECERDPIDAGVVSTVSGNAYDSSNNMPVPNIKMKVGEYKSHFVIDGNGEQFIQWIDSTYTDANGDYNLSFTTSGLGDTYKLFPGESTVDVKGFNDIIDIVNIGGDSVFDFQYLHLYPVNLVITVNNVNTIPIKISNYYNFSIDEINQTTGVFNRLLYLNKNVDNEVGFSIDTDPNNYYPDYSDIKSYVVTVPATNSTSVVDVSITLNDSDFN